MDGKDHKSEMKNLEKVMEEVKRAKGKSAVIRGESKKVPESILRT